MGTGSYIVRGKGSADSWQWETEQRPQTLNNEVNSQQVHCTKNHIVHFTWCIVFNNKRIYVSYMMCLPKGNCLFGMHVIIPRRMVLAFAVVSGNDPHQVLNMLSGLHEVSNIQASCATAKGQENPRTTKGLK